MLGALIIGRLGDGESYGLEIKTDHRISLFEAPIDHGPPRSITAIANAGYVIDAQIFDDDIAASFPVYELL
jgi:hypothetical protein